MNDLIDIRDVFSSDTRLPIVLLKIVAFLILLYLAVMLDQRLQKFETELSIARCEVALVASATSNLDLGARNALLRVTKTDDPRAVMNRPECQVYMGVKNEAR